jgi:3-methyladenine DNA glycosylase/8-oxoguanine DNA glycosylase
MPVRTFSPPGPLNLRLTLGPLRRGGFDPCVRLSRAEALRATRTPEGPATIHLTARAGEVTAQAWGPGAEWALENAPRLVGCEDEPSAFQPSHPALRDLQKRLTGLRLGRCDAVMEVLVPTVLEQKVTGIEARRSYARLVHRFGEPAPGPFKLRVPPPAEALAALPYFEWHPLGVERKRADVIRRACIARARLEEISDCAPPEAAKRLRAISGIGPWTAAHVITLAMGDPDQMIVGDYHLPHLVGWVLAGEIRGSDARMLELLEPLRGQRGRAVRLIAVGGDRPARVAPRRALRSFARI